MSTTEPQLRITLFGEFGMHLQGKPTPTFSGDRPISLLAYLLLHRQTAVSRSHLAYILWPDSSDSQARANLRNLFYTLRQTLPNADSYLAADSMTLQWRTDARYTLDVAEFEDALAAAHTAVTAEETIQWLETAVNTYTGDLLPSNYEDWISPFRETLRHAYQNALHQLVRLLQQNANYRTAVQYGQLLIQHDPLDESAYVLLMRLHALNGSRAGIRRVYEQCVAILNRELGVEPGPATQAAYEQLLRHEAPSLSLLETNTRLTIAQLRPSPLPVPAIPFIGREAELASLAELLADPACRLLTIVGPGGIGKTRLALQTAVGQTPHFADGVAWVPLNTWQTPNQLITAVAEALHYQLNSPNAEAELLHMLAERRLLLVLDDFEHLLPTTDFLARILHETTAVKLLITSRQATELPEEWRFDLAELPIPNAQAAESWADNSAIQLFVQSARRAASPLILQSADYPAIATICQRVGGIPLGIELAASWVRLLSCAEIAQEIEKNLDFLTATQRNTPPRHRSLRAVFNYSWELLTSEEQQILCRLSVFQEGFTREAAAHIAHANLPQLSSLVDRSMVQRISVDATAGRLTTGRYGLHNVIRQYAHEYLQAEPLVYAETVHQHSSYYLQWLAERGSVLRGATQKEGLTAVADEMANIRAAWEWGTAQQWLPALRQAAFALFYFCELRGLIHDGEALFRLTADALQGAAVQGTAVQGAAHTDSEHQITVCAMRTYQAYFLHRMRQNHVAQALLQEAVSQLETLGEADVLSYSLRFLGLTLWVNGRFDEADQVMQQSHALAVRNQDQWGMVISQAYLGVIIRSQGNLAEALAQLTAVLSHAQALGDPRLIAYILLASGRSNLNAGHMAEAEQQLTTCLEIAQETNDFFNIANSCLYLGKVKQAQGDLVAAREFIQQSITLCTQTKDLFGLCDATIGLGFLEIAAGDDSAARSQFQAILQLQDRAGVILFELSAVIGMASLSAREGDAAVAMGWVLAVLQHPALHWETQQRAEALRVELQAQLTPEQIAHTEREAAGQPFSAVLAAVLEQ